MTIARRLGPLRPDRILAEGVGRLTVLACREKTGWDKLATIEVGGSFYRVEGVAAQPDGAWRALAYRLTEYEPHGVIRGLIVHSGEPLERRPAVGLAIADGLLSDSASKPESIPPPEYSAAPRTFGTDEALAGPDGTVRLSCRAATGWRARSPSGLHGVAHPGAAVEWDGAWYEVVADEPLRGGGVRYTLGSGLVVEQ